MQARPMVLRKDRHHLSRRGAGKTLYQRSKPMKKNPHRSEPLAKLEDEALVSLSDAQLEAVFGGIDPLLVPPEEDDSDLKPERVQGW
jgi:hypothetical protein